MARLHRLLFALVFILLSGMLVSYAVAWGVSQWAPLPLWSPMIVRTPAGPLWATPDSWPASDGMSERFSSGGGIGVTRTTVGWSGRATVSGSIDEYTHELLEFGFPYRAVRMVSLRAWPAAGPRSVEAPGMAGGLVIGDVRVPISPVWPGLMANTLVYGLASYLLLVRGSRLVRQAIQLVRGPCESCGYDCRATGGWCPECGRRSGWRFGFGDR